jgi:hypothetical protein
MRPGGTSSTQPAVEGLCDELLPAAQYIAEQGVQK